MKTQLAPPTRLRRAAKGMCYALLALLFLALLGSGGLAWWLWGWRTGDLEFHESWTDQQRAELQEVHDKLGMVVSDTLDMQDIWLKAFTPKSRQDESKFMQGLSRLIRYIRLSIILRPECRAVDDVLRQAAATGRADIYGEYGISPAIFAARYGKANLVKELVRRGNSPNRAVIINSPTTEEPTQYETLFQTCIACLPIKMDDSPPPLVTRLELLEWLLDHGADINAYAEQQETNRSLHIAYVVSIFENQRLRKEERGILLAWLLDHGLKIHTQRHLETLSLYFADICSLPALSRIIESGALGELTPSQKAYFLREIALRRCSTDKAEKTRWLLEHTGADPNLVLMRETIDDDDKIRSYEPTMQSFAARFFADCEGPLNAEEEATFEENLQTLDVLLSHGGMLDNALKYAPASPDLRERYLAVLRKHGIPTDGNDTAPAPNSRCTL